MKKTLVALAVTAFATSASALTIYDVDGSKVTFDGSLRMRLDNGAITTKTDGNKKKDEYHTNLHNDGSRFGITLNHAINDDLYGLGRVEFRFNGDTTGTDKFGDLYTEKAFVGIGSKTYGELTFGRQATIGDDVHLAGFDNAYGTFDTALTTEGRAVVRYDYKSIEGLQVGLDYRFAEDRDDNGEVNNDEDLSLKSGYGVGAIYEFDVAENQSLAFGAGYTRDNYVDYMKIGKKYHRDAWGAGVKYTINDLELAADYTGHFMKYGSDKNIINGFRVGTQYHVTPKLAVYGNYGFIKNDLKTGSVKTGKETRHRFMLGTSYQLHDQVFTYVEGRIRNSKEETYGTTKVVKKIREREVGVGLRIFW